ncbi:MAG: DNA polymerase III subunit gamma/tau [Alphaproteobacteria bacterium]
MNDGPDADPDIPDDDALPPGPGLGLDAPEQPRAPAGGGKSGSGYLVLARKYRPKTFDELIGQDALVRTLSNAIETGRIAQAFMLTGVRGVGKTTTARIVAKALNCVGPDGTGGPTIAPCGECANCRGIAEDRHVDVIEMDAASHNGIDDIRDLIDGVRYRPVSARYKVYVLDEVHMLSKPAFNALLKTLEEPPEHVKFVFATTEIRKVPVTVLSRCQRFDLRRVPVDRLIAHFQDIAGKEQVTIEDEAVGMVARAADGSVRDGLSILDQAIALSTGTVTAEQVRDMLGLADRNRIFDLFDLAMKGDAAPALALLEDMYHTGADPAVVIEDLLEITHFLTRAILVPDALDRPTTAELERTKGREMAGALSLPILARAWQMLLKGLSEVRAAPVPFQAAEMVLIRLIHAADMPTPGDLVAKLKDASGVSEGPSAPTGGGGGGGGPMASAIGRPAVVARAETPQAEPQAQARPAVEIKSFLDLVALLEQKREALLATHLKRDVHLVRLEPGRLEIRPGPHAPRDLHGNLGKVLGTMTGTRWIVSLSNEEGAPTLAEQEEAAEQERRSRAESDPLVQAIKSAFPEAQITRVAGREDAAQEDADMAAAAVEPDPDELPDGDL